MQSTQRLEDYLDAKAASQALGGKVTPKAILAWVREGKRGVRLNHIEIGRKVYTTVKDLLEFCAAVGQAKRQPKPQPQRPPSSRQRRSQIERAKAELARW